MKLFKLFLVTFLIPLFASGATSRMENLTVGGFLKPSASGVNLGSTTQRWSVWLNALNTTLGTGAAYVDGSGNLLTDTAVSPTELNYLNGLNGNIQDQLDGKEDLVTPGTNLQYWRGDKVWTTLDTSVVPENGNLYHTDARAREAISASAPVEYNDTTGVISMPEADADSDGYMPWEKFAQVNDLETRLDAEEVYSAAVEVRLDAEEAATIAHDGRLDVLEAQESLPVGGTDGQVLVKQSAIDGDADWEDVAAGGGGAKNYIQNPNAVTDATTGITATNTTVSRNTTTPLFETSDFSFTIDSATDVVAWTADAFDNYLKNTGICQAEFVWTADANGENVQAQVYRNGSVIGQKNLYTTTNPATASIAFQCGDLVNATTFRIVGTAATTTALKVSQVKLTEAQWSKDPVGGTVVGTIKWPGTTNCQFNNGASSQSWQAFAADSDCSAPTVKGSITAPSTKIPGFGIPNADPGSVYTVELKGAFESATGNQACSFRATDGSITSSPVAMGYPSADQIFPHMEFEYSPTTAGSKDVTFQATGTFGTTTCYMLADTAYRELEITVKRFPRDQAVVNLKAQSGDFGPTNFSMTITGTSSNPTKGANTEVAKYSRTGAFMGINYSLTQTGAGAAGSGCYLFSVPGGQSVDTNEVFSSTSSFNGVVGTAKISNSTGSAQRKFGTVHVYDATRLWVAIQTTATDVDCLSNSNAPLSDAAQLISFEVPRIPIKNWTKSNTAVNIAGEPGVWSGKHGNDCSWTYTTTSPTDPTAGDASCTFTEMKNTNFGTVTSYTQSSNNSSGLNITPKLTGNYYACANVSGFSSAAGAVYSLTDGTTEIGVGFNYASVNQGSHIAGQNVCGVLSTTAGVAKTLKIQGASQSSGTTTVSGQYSSGALLPAIQWTIFPITQNLPGLLGGTSSGSKVYSLTFGGSVTSNCSSSPCTIYKESGPTADWVSSVTRASGGQYTVNFQSGIFGTAPTCVANAIHWSSNKPAIAGHMNGLPTISAADFNVRESSTDAHTDAVLSIFCTE